MIGRSLPHGPLVQVHTWFRRAEAIPITASMLGMEESFNTAVSRSGCAEGRSKRSASSSSPTVARYGFVTGELPDSMPMKS